MAPTRSTTGHDTFVGPRTTRVLAALLLVVGVGAAVGGIAYAVTGATGAAGAVAVPVSLSVDDAAPGGGPVAVGVDGVTLPQGTRLDAVDGGLVLVDGTGDASPWTGFLARSDAALVGLALAASALLLAPVLTSVAAGEPFRRGNASRVAGTAAAVLVVGMVAPLLPQLAGLGVLDRLGLAEAGSPFVVGVGFDLAPIGIAALLLVAAEAFRRGTQIAADTAGLV